MARSLPPARGARGVFCEGLSFGFVIRWIRLPARSFNLQAPSPHGPGHQSPDSKIGLSTRAGSFAVRVSSKAANGAAPLSLADLWDRDGAFGPDALAAPAGLVPAERQCYDTF